METLIEKLRKIEALARSGVDGERENAQKLLDDLCRKHGVTPEELAAEQTKPHFFTVKNANEVALLRQCAIHVCGTSRVQNACQGKRHTFWLTAAQGIDVKDCFEHHRKPFAQHMDDAASAYILRNKILGPPRAEDETNASHQNEEARAQAKRIAALMVFMQSNRWEKRALLTG